MAEADRVKTAFITPFGFYQFKRIPFGLQGAPATSQRLMDRLVHGLNDFSAAYIDNLVIFSTSWKDHLQHLRQVLHRLKDAELTAKPKKCQLAMKTCSYLGHIVGSGVVRPALDKVQAVQEFAIPQTKTDVRAFLGLTGYYRKFIPNYATIALPLTDLTRKTAPNQVQWDSHCEVAFCKLKELLCSSPVLQSPDFSRQFILQT